MRISDWSSDVCSSDLLTAGHSVKTWGRRCFRLSRSELIDRAGELLPNGPGAPGDAETQRYRNGDDYENGRSEENTSELQSLMRISYAVFCLKKKNKQHPTESRN